MTDRLRPQETAAMFTLMALGREVSNPELKKLVGFTVTGKEKTRLEEGGYIASRTGPRNAWIHELTDKGWAWCRDELSVREPPANSRSTLVSGLYVLLGGFDQYLRQHHLSLADVFGPTIKDAADVPPAEEPEPEGDLESRIRIAYRELVKEPRGWVGLVDLRPKLGAPASEVDAALKELSRAGKVHLVPEDNRKALTAADHEAAIRIGGEDNHLLSIEAL